MRFAAALVGALCSLTFSPLAHADKPLMAYYGGWYGSSQADNIPWGLLTQINVAFAGIDSNYRCAWMNMNSSDTADTSGTLPAGIEALIRTRNARNPNVKIVLSVGGDSMSYRFSKAVSQNESTNTLASSCVQLMTSLGMDGIDYDWEYPGRLGVHNCPNIPSAPAPCADWHKDAAGFTQLLQATRALLGPNAVLSAALFDNAADTASNNAQYDYAGLAQNLDFLNVMVYSVHGWPGEAATGFNAPMSQARNSLAYFVQQGVPANKLILGVPYYGASWCQVAHAGAGEPGNFYGVAPYSDIAAGYGQDPQCQLTHTSDGEGAYYYCSGGARAQCWMSVDDPAVMLQKATYVAQNNYGGVMFWMLPGDTADFQLTQALAEGLANSVRADGWGSRSGPTER